MALLSSMPVRRPAAPLAVPIRVSPERPHPSQRVDLFTSVPAQVGDQVELVDGRGVRWRIATGVSNFAVGFTLPDDVADGKATVRVGRVVDGAERFGTPMSFVITSGPLPLSHSAGRMRSVAPGQWTDLAVMHDDIFEFRRADRVEIEFRQGDVIEIVQAGGQDGRHVRVPASLVPGIVSVRTRTWIEQTVSEWSAPAEFVALARRVGAAVTSIVEEGPRQSVVPGVAGKGPILVKVTRGHALVLRGQFPVERAADLRVQLRRIRHMLPAESIDLQPTDVDRGEGVRVRIPVEATGGAWQLLIGTADGVVPLTPATTVLVR